MQRTIDGGRPTSSSDPYSPNMQQDYPPLPREQASVIPPLEVMSGMGTSVTRPMVSDWANNSDVPRSQLAWGKDMTVLK
jgi:hypothetical protein